MSWRVLESLVAYFFSGRLRPGSGSFRPFKGDVITDDYLIECKSTEKQQFVLKKEILLKIEKEAISEGRVPLLVVRFEDKRNSSGGIYVISKLDDFLEMNSGE